MNSLRYLFRTQRSYFKLAQALEYRDHNPVMVDEVLKYMNPESTHTIIDMTFGAGGHSLALLEKNKDLIIVALDRDPIGYEKACSLAVKYPTRIIPLLGKFSELPKLMHSVGLKQNSMDGVLFDFGCSSMQFDTADRGFSISKEGPLDMRMDGNRYPDQLTAMDILERAPEEDLARIFRVYGEEKQYKKIARGIVESRYLFRKLETTTELADLISSICDGEIRFDKLDRKAHCATKVFQALRIFVNDELNEINHGMHVAKSLLKIGGRLITISFHSLEDTIIKRHLSGNLICDVANPVPLKYSSPTLFHDKESIENVMDTCWKSLTKHVVIPSTKEIESNPRSRSAKLRAAVKVK